MPRAIAGIAERAPVRRRRAVKSCQLPRGFLRVRGHHAVADWRSTTMRPAYDLCEAAEDFTGGEKFSATDRLVRARVL